MSKPPTAPQVPATRAVQLSPKRARGERQQNFRLSELDVTLLEALTENERSTKSNVITRLIREEARRLGIYRPVTVDHNLTDDTLAVHPGKVNPQPWVPVKGKPAGRVTPRHNPGHEP